MSRKLTRRELLQLAAAGTGGLMLGSLGGCRGSGESGEAPASNMSRSLDFAGTR